MSATEECAVCHNTRGMHDHYCPRQPGAFPVPAVTRITQAKSVTGTVTATKRVNTSSMGNPQFDVTILATHIEGTPLDRAQEVTVRTSANISLAYGIENPEYRDTPHTFDLTRAGRLSGRAVAVTL